MNLHIIFVPVKSDNGPPSLTFIDVHTDDGKSVSVGKWAADGDYETLCIDTDNPLDLKLPPYREENDFILEAADQYGFIMNDDGTGYMCLNEDLIALVKAAREQGREDSMASKDPCDCERGHNGMGMTGRECDCKQAKP